jgi:hypothetical protein
VAVSILKSNVPNAINLSRKLRGDKLFA